MSATAPPPAPRAFDVAAAHFLADSSAFVSRFAWDGAARTWRDLGTDGRPVRFEVVVSVATDLLHEALAARDVPLVFRCVFAPADAAERLAAVASWRAHREACARSGFPITGGVLGTAQRERLLRAVSRRGVDSALRLASGMAECRYVAQVASVDVDPRAFVAALPRVPGAVVLQTALYAAYRDALPDRARPMHERAFHALAVEVLGDGDPTVCRVKRRGLRYYRDLLLPAPGDVEDLDHNSSGPPRLRLVDTA